MLVSKFGVEAIDLLYRDLAVSRRDLPDQRTARLVSDWIEHEVVTNDRCWDNRGCLGKWVVLKQRSLLRKPDQTTSGRLNIYFHSADVRNHDRRMTSATIIRTR